MNFDTPEGLLQLGTIMGLLRAKKGDDVGGLLMNMAGQQEQIKSRRQQQEMLKLQQEAAQMQLQQQRKAFSDQDAIRDLAARSFAPPQALDPRQQEGGEQMIPGGGGMQQFTQGLMGIDPMQALRMMPKPQGPVALSAGGKLVDPVTGRVVADNPKQSGPQVGQTREIKTGGRILTYEWDGKDWKKLGDAPQFKPDAPDKPDTMKPPPGYRFSADGSKLEAIPGGPADAKVGKEAEAAQKRQEGAINTAKVTLSKVQEAIKGVGVMTTGPIGAMARNIPGTGGYDLARTIDTIKANIGFDKLQAMREASPTGGALGNVAIQELNMLQSVLGSLDTAQSPDQLLKSLYAVEKHYQNWLRAVESAKAGDSAPQAGGTVRRFNPQTGRIE